MPSRLAEYFAYDGLTDQGIPDEYLTTVSRWPVDFNIKQARKVYHALQPVVTPLAEWGAPTWDTLMLPQRLSSLLIETILSDHSHELSRWDLPSFQSQANVVCWQIVYSAAPSHLQCPPTGLSSPSFASPTSQRSNHVFQMESSEITGEHLRHVYRCFRDCLVVICPRLDETLYVMREVGLMAGQIRKQKPRSGVGIILSSWQVVAVAVDGLAVRHSPALDIRNGVKGLGEGILLLMHLLNPTLIALQIPWMPTGANELYHKDWWPVVTGPTLPKPIQAHTSLPILPEEIIQTIIYYTDWHTHILVLPLVSRLFRYLSLAHPRIGNHILLGHDRGFRFYVRHISANNSGLATLTRRIGQRGIYGTFQHSRIAKAEDFQSNTPRGRQRTLPRRSTYVREGAEPKPDSYIGVQVLHGMWGMVGEGKT